MNIDRILKKTNEYLGIPSVVSLEEHFLNFLQEDLNLPGYKINRMNGVLAVKSINSKSDRVITAHIDRHGIITNPSRDFELACSYSKKCYGEEVKYSEKLFHQFGERISNEPVVAQDKKGKIIGRGFTKNYVLDYEKKELFYHIEGIGESEPGTVIAFDSKLNIDGDMVNSQIDNVICVGIIYELIRQGFEGHFLLTAEEEIGRSWKHIVDYLQSENIETDSIITLDTSPFAEDSYLVNGSVVLRNRDEQGSFNPVLTEKLKTICINHDIPYVVKDELIDAKNAELPEGTKKKSVGKTELGKIIQSTDRKFNGTTLQLPTTGYHTNHETTSKSSIKNFCSVLQKL
ncbi:hypothetical protein KAJ27_16330 [bacterium]|nr:hypothetical protein [bacterium]